ncbi:MAG: START-like domain-containing protein [Phocaeicola sp.]|nr:START-like domain-containing protein [Phocaeicola sp.]
MKQKFQIEFLLSSSSGYILWNAIGTASGLQRWFADEIHVKGHTYTFRWGKIEERPATLIKSREGEYVRFRWNDEQDDKTFFELRLLYNELTDDFHLRIVDFAEEGEVEDMIDLWNSQLENFTRAYGIYLTLC